MDSTTLDMVQNVRSLVDSRIAKVLSSTKANIPAKFLSSGKMLRTRLAARLFTGDTSVDTVSLQAACAATEIVHTASLCHDDVVDNSLIRRSLPTLWRVSGPSGAVLIGDLLLCEAMDLLMATEDGRYLPSFLAKVREVVEAEAQQELLWRGQAVDAETCLRLGRGKTGPLFAFIAGVGGGDNEALCSLLEEAGYRIGTAYQLTDDLLDVLGTEGRVGKTLGTDLIRGKFTLPQNGDEGEHIARENICKLCISAVELLNDFPKPQEGLREFLRCDLHPVMEQTLGEDMGIAI